MAAAVLAKRLLTLGLALWVWVPSAAVAQSPTTRPGEPVALASTFEHRLHSRIADREFIVWVSLPPSYRTGATGTGARYPTLYLLDGRQSLQLALPMLRLTNRGQSGEIILVGVGYPLDSRGLPSCGAVLCRDIDYVPPPFGGPSPYAAQNLPAPGAEVFLRVLKEEIIPFVEARYPTSSDRGLYGHSQGGMFAAYALFEASELFNRFAATSLGGFQWDVESMLRRERAFRARMPALRKVVYFSVGSEEPPIFIADTWRIISALCDGMFTANTYQGLAVFAATLPAEEHRSSAHIAHALEALYPPDSAQPPRPPIRDITQRCARR